MGQRSFYIKTYPFGENQGHLLYSTKRGAIIAVPEEDYHAIKYGLLTAKAREDLTALGIIVPDREEEKREVAGLLDLINTKRNCLNITAVMNLDCNFACTYCYEGSFKGRHYMSEETAGLLINFVKTSFTTSINYIHIDFYGGEPLLSLDTIKAIASEVKTFTKEKDASFSFAMITNGSLFSRKVAEELLPLGLRDITITLDGPADLHNKCRPFKGGQGSFDTVIKNIRETCDSVRIGIGGNYQEENYKRFPELLTFLEEEGLTFERISAVRFGPVMKQLKDVSGIGEFSGGCISVNEPWLIKAGAMLREEILKRGYYTPKIVPTPCQVEINSAYVVNYDGDFYKCPAFIGRKEFSVGDLRSGLKDYTDLYRLGHWKNEECLDCEYLPLCFGGCRYMAYLRDGDIGKVDCKRQYLEESLETLITQDILYRRP